MRQSLIIVDVNTIWHRRIAEALSGQMSTIALSPHADLLLRSPSIKPKSDTGMQTVRIALPLGWASRTAAVSQRILAHRITRLARSMPAPAVMITSPAYAPLVRALRGRFPIVYYCADDYCSYAGWRNVARNETNLMALTDLAVFVSESLRTRAVSEWGLAQARSFVSPNATEPRFADITAAPPPALEGFARPILGVLGALSDRLNLDLIRAATSLSEVGTLLVAGPVASELRSRHDWIDSPKVHVTGRVPHEEMHRYAQAMDAALIPYARTELNRHCSPMRLWDHLGTGVPIFALETCDQITRLDDARLFCGSPEAVLNEISATISTRRRSGPKLTGLTWDDRARELAKVITEL